MPREAALARIYRRDTDDWAGIALASALGLGAGLVAGLVVGELLGTVDGDRMRRAFGRLRRREPDEPRRDPLDVQRDVKATLGRNPTTRGLDLGVRALGEGIVEVTGAAPDDTARTLAGDLARGVEGADVVVNRILVEGTDVPRRERSPSSTG